MLRKLKRSHIDEYILIPIRKCIRRYFFLGLIASENGYFSISNGPYFAYETHTLPQTEIWMVSTRCVSTAM